jgi:hypothetical protein
VQKENNRTTGDIRRSPRSEVTIDLSLLAELLLPGTHEVPGPRGYTLDTSCHAPDTLACTVRRDARPIVVLTVARTKVALAAAIDRVCHIPAGADLWAPACLVDVLASDTALEWIGDLERCLAWAWIERQG